MKTKHTPGDWKAHLNVSLAIIPGHIVKVDNAVKTPIACVPVGGGTHGVERQRANAILMAAAPKMFKALLLADAAIERVGRGIYAKRMVKAAIRAATEEAQ